MPISLTALLLLVMPLASTPAPPPVVPPPGLPPATARASPPGAPSGTPVAPSAAVPRTGAPDPGPAPVWPLTGAFVAEGFAPPPVRWAPGHRGVDLLGRAGQPVRSVSGGRVVFAGTVAGRGVVSVEPDGSAPGRRVTYEPLRPSVTPGDRVVPGDTLGTLAAAGSHCAPRACLHWGLRVGEAYQDPLSLLSTGPSVLLPLTGVPVPREGGVR